MKRFNRPLTLFATLVLTLTVALLFWLRGRLVGGLEEVVENTIRSFAVEEVLRTPDEPGTLFSAAEQFVAIAKRNPYIRDMIVTKRLDPDISDKTEIPIVPYNLDAVAIATGGDWRDRVEGWRSEALGTGGKVYGRLYIDLDRSMIVSVNLAIGAASVALIASLTLLLGRLYTQETTIQRVGIELEERRQELIRVGRLALAGQLSANLFHDLKKPVLSIRHKMEDLKDALGDFAGASIALKETGDQVDLFFQMLSDSQMERFVRSDRVQEEYVDINHILDISVKLVHYERGLVELIVKPVDQPPLVLAQPFRLVQVFSNLILNAYQAIDGKGTLTLESRAAGGGVEVTVTDTGPGIPIEALPSVFEPFFTTKSESEGSGLGLAITRLIVEELNGTVEVDSTAGGPTTFRVWLPAEETPSDGNPTA